MSLCFTTLERLTLCSPVVYADLEPAVVLPTNIEIAQGEELTATCNALSSLQTHTAWFKVSQMHFFWGHFHISLKVFGSG